MRQARIAIVTNIVHERDYMFPGYPRIALNEDFPRSIEAAGALPFLLAPSETMQALRAQLEVCDALFLTGGEDVNSLYYGEEPHPLTHESNPRRDRYEMACLKLAEELGLPVFGVCRGMQIINVYFGGTNWQDNSLAGAKLRHENSSNPDLPVHSIAITPGSFLEKAIGRLESSVNSYHHQSLHEIPQGFQVAARAKDGIIEALERQSGPFCAGVQWHPEMLSRHQEDAQKIFRYFIRQVEAGMKD